MGHYMKQHQDGHGLLLRDDEIDLFELLAALKKNLWLIAGITALCTLCAIAYGMLATPKFQASAMIGMPTQSTLNRIDGAAGLYALEPEQEYMRLFKTMINQDLQKRFYLENIAPEESGLPLTDAERQKAFESFSRKLSVNRNDKGRNVSHDHIQVSFSSETPEEAYRVLSSFLNFMNEQTLLSIREDYLAELEFAQKTFQKEIELLIDAKAMRISNEISRLRESARMATNMGIEEPLIVDNTTYDGLAKDDPSTHLLGYKFLNSRIEMLESRKELEAFTPGVAELKARLESIKAVQLNTGVVDLMAFQKSPTVPHTRISPRRTLIAVLGLMLGLFLGCAIALLKVFVANHKARPEIAAEPGARRVPSDSSRKEALSFVLRSDQEQERRESSKSTAV